MTNFGNLKIELIELKNDITNNENKIIDLINTILLNFNSKLTVRKNMSINSFMTLLLNSNTEEQFKNYLNKLDINKDYLIESVKDYKEDIKFNEEFKNDDIKTYEMYKSFLDSAIKFNKNLYVIPYID